jgi:DNA-binding MarR family transcriptional regulator
MVSLAPLHAHNTLYNVLCNDGEREDADVVDDIVEQLGHLALGTRLKRIGERLQGETTRFIAADGLAVPASAFPLLAALDRPGGLTVGELADAVGVSQPAVTRSVTRLVHDGLVTVASEESDRRRRSVRLTEAGADVVLRARASIWPHIAAAVAEACAGLEGPLLAQLAELEARLDSEPVDRRAERLAGEASR